ncbi:MAG: MotA/TolQ/ExbB proton channel family protein [Saprospiraceae bacterium]|nr:MotA/TolQ/ExbB proton channel family protein [Saprospiraceae bacterium]
MNNLLLFISLQAQALPETAEQSTTTLWYIIASGGPIGVIIVGIQVLLSFVAMYIFIERYLTIKKAGKVDPAFYANIKTAVATGNIEGAKTLCQTHDSPTSRMIYKGLMRIGKPLRDIETSIENVGNLELFQLEKNLSTIASVSGVSPMLGFLGTVTGMIIAFYKMATQANVTPDVLAGGIYQALITTAFGLVVGIFALMGYNYLVSQVDKVVFIMEQASVEFMDLLQEPSK